MRQPAMEPVHREKPHGGTLFPNLKVEDAEVHLSGQLLNALVNVLVRNPLSRTRTNDAMRNPEIRVDT
jgi:hypothetical protein